MFYVLRRQRQLTLSENCPSGKYLYIILRVCIKNMYSMHWGDESPPLPDCARLQERIGKTEGAGPLFWLLNSLDPKPKRLSFFLTPLSSMKKKILCCIAVFFPVSCVYLGNAKRARRRRESKCLNCLKCLKECTRLRVYLWGRNRLEANVFATEKLWLISEKRR